MLHRYIVLVPTEVGGPAYEAARRRVRAKFGAETPVVDTAVAACWVFQRPPSQLGYRRLAGGGCVIGFDVNAGLQDPESFIDGTWGAYVTLGIDAATGLVTVLRDPSGRVACWRLRLDGVRLASAPADGPWWAQLSMPGGRFGWQAPLRLDGAASLRMKDVGILLALFAERSAFPKWVGKLIDEGEVAATSRVRVDGKSVVLDRLSAHNARVDLQARLRLSGNQPYGDLYARWGVLGLGVQLQGGKRDLHLVGAKRWYDSRPPLLR